MKFLSSLSMVRNSFSSWVLPDDEVSTTSLQSTVSVDFRKPIIPTSSPVTSSGARTVRFDESLNIYHDNTTMSQEECTQLWSTRTDLKRFKSLTVATAKAMGQSEPVNPFHSFSYKHVLLAAYDACCQTLSERASSPLSEDEATYLQLMTQASLDRVGLESLCVADIRLDKQARRAQIVEAVLELAECGITDPDHIREVCQPISRAPRLYAQAVAVAQWGA